MKRLIFLLSIPLLVSCGNPTPKILLFITEGSRDLELMLPKEVVVMKDLVEQADLEVDIASLSGESFKVEGLTVVPDLKLEEVNPEEYDGFLFPCLAPPWDKIYDPNTEVVDFIRAVSEEGKPLAAQTLSVPDFAKAGILAGKKYAFTIDPDVNEYPEFEGALFSGEGVIQDGNIITSGTCPWKAREYGAPDGTQKLTELFIKAVLADTE
jgi:putative intracellular protease/amidase